MLRQRWFPWRFIVRRVARAHGFLDPVALMAHLHRFGQPSEVAEPIELLRAGVVFHARGLINSRVIQHNLDWVWPYWVERQFDPEDDAFVPRAFSVTHVNLTHRNWTALGLPDCDELPIVDPRGLLTPCFDGWSLDVWVHTADGVNLLPSRARDVTQTLDIDAGLTVVTRARLDGAALETRADVARADGMPVCRLDLQAQAEAGGWAIVALRPYNPEGVSLVHRIALSADRKTWTIDDERRVGFGLAAERHHVSSFRAGDVHIHLDDLDDQRAGDCEVGMATAAAMFRIEPGLARAIPVEIPLAGDHHAPRVRPSSWADALRGHCRLQVPDARFRFLYEAAVRTLILHSPGDVYPGPFTYKRFWFRDAAFILHALLCAGLTDRARAVLDRFPARQRASGFFHSQEGEWDSNGEALWILWRYCALTGTSPEPAWWHAIQRGARWIARKRVADHDAGLHAGLLPAGFSAEHLGPNDFYYWDDFWGVAGLRAAAKLGGFVGETNAGRSFDREAESFQTAIERSLAQVAERLGRPAMPASPYRRLDAGAIGSIVAGYPLGLWSADDPRLTDSLAFLLDTCFVRGGFFQDMIHAGINPYLTLHVAQCLLRAGDPRSADLIRTVAALASPTGQWPEAIHPRTRGGCMGDGQHVWAAAEWVLMMRNCFVREEGDRLILASGVLPEWLEAEETLSLGPTPTPWGDITVTIEPTRDGLHVSWHANWRAEAPYIEVRAPGVLPMLAEPGQRRVVLGHEAALGPMR